MGDLALVLAVAVITYSSRAAAVVFLPSARGPLLEFVARIPAPLFAGLAVFALLGEELVLPEPPVLAAAFSAILASPKKSLGLTLAAGITGFALVELLT